MENGVILGRPHDESYMARDGEQQLLKEMKLPYTLNIIGWEVKMNFLLKKF